MVRLSVGERVGVRWRLGDVLADVLACWLLAFAACGFAQGTGRPATQALFLDDSGSMRPYYASGQVRDITEPLANSINAGSSLQLYAFSTGVFPARSLQAIEAAPFGQYTFLDKVIDQCLNRHVDIGWIVTDNIEDTGEAGNTERFYARLRSEAVHRVTVFPVRAPAGHPGLVVYALLFNPSSGPLYASTLQSFMTNGSRVLRTEPLLMKPVDQDTVEVTSRDLAPLTRRGGPKVYDTGVPLQAQAEVRFRSRLDHIEIVDSSLHILDAKPAFGPASLLEPTARQLSITPDRIRDLGPGRETAQVYHLTADLGELQLKHSPAVWWRAAWGHPEEEAELPLTFAIDVPERNFRLRRPFLDQWSAPTVADARATGKVYALDRLLASINAGDTHIQVTSPLFFRVRYPTWPAVLWVSLAGLLLASMLGAALAARRLFRRRTRAWSVRAATPDGQPLSATLQSGRILVDGQPLARLEGPDLLALPPARLAAGTPRVTISAYQPVRLTHRMQAVDLFFTPASQAVSPAPHQNATSPAPSAIPSAQRSANAAPRRPSASPTTMPPRRR